MALALPRRLASMREAERGGGVIGFVWGVVVGMLLEMFLSAWDRSKQVHYSTLSDARTIKIREVTDGEDR